MNLMHYLRLFIGLSRTAARLPLLFVLALLAAQHAEGQISAGGQPLAFAKNTQLRFGDVPVQKMPSFDLQALLAEDSVERAQGMKALRFGKPFAVSLGLENSGVWTELPDGGRVWRLAIQSKGAKTLNFTFGQYRLPAGGRLFIYDEQGKETLGAFTERNNKTTGDLGTTLIRGERAYLEYYEPAGARGLSQLRLTQVVHGYRDLYSLAKAYRDSGSCNINVNCSEGDEWREQIRSVALIIVSGMRWCTGALINNTANDGTPYFLTADHCLTASVSNWVFVFNYETTGCSNSATEPSLSMSVSGSELLANSTATDVALLELSEAPPAEYEVYYAGWSRAGSGHTRATCIHHPSGDVKKISHDINAPYSANSNGQPSSSGSFWGVVWDEGTTEGGSSGSPLFNEDKRIIGQLLGGAAACSNPNGFDVYGQLSDSYSLIDEWLDPLGTGATAIDGVNAEGVVTLEVSATDTRECGTSLTTTFSANSNEAITAYQWSFPGGTPASSTAESPTVSYENEGEFDVELTITTDQGETTRTLSDFIFLRNGVGLVLNLFTDDFPEETSWRIIDGSSTIVAAGSGYSLESGLIQEELCLDNGCYTFELRDSFGDGIFDGGGIVLETADGEELLTLDGNFNSVNSGTFCAEDENIVPEVSFSATRTQSCLEAMTTTFSASANVNVSTYQWSFPGGQPSSSNEAQPTVTYNGTGDYDVSLTITSASRTASSSVNDFISLQNGDLVFLTIRTDDWPEETSWQVLDESDAIVASGDGYSQQSGLVQEEFCLVDGCYTLELRDSANDGIFNGGGISLETASGDELLELDGDFTSNTSGEFCVGIALGTDTEEETFGGHLTLAPNPSDGRFNLTLENKRYGTFGLRVYDATGREVLQQSVVKNTFAQSFALDLSAQKQGLYFIEVSNEGRRAVRRAVKR